MLVEEVSEFCVHIQQIELTGPWEAVEKSGVVSNEYWAVSSAVLNNTATTASMLLALQ